MVESVSSTYKTPGLIIKILRAVNAGEDGKQQDFSVIAPENSKWHRTATAMAGQFVNILF